MQKSHVAPRYHGKSCRAFGQNGKRTQVTKIIGLSHGVPEWTGLFFIHLLSDLHIVHSASPRQHVKTEHQRATFQYEGSQNTFHTLLNVRQRESLLLSTNTPLTSGVNIVHRFHALHYCPLSLFYTLDMSRMHLRRWHLEFVNTVYWGEGGLSRETNFEQINSGGSTAYLRG